MWRSEATLCVSRAFSLSAAERKDIPQRTQPLPRSPHNPWQVHGHQLQHLWWIRREAELPDLLCVRAFKLIPLSFWCCHSLNDLSKKSSVVPGEQSDTQKGCGFAHEALYRWEEKKQPQKVHISNITFVTSASNECALIVEAVIRPVLVGHSVN